jgi:threonine/homoserine/homoserine lactone efflux protein
MGSLPPGVMNLLGVEIYHREGLLAVSMYVTGFMLAEAIVVRAGLVALSWLNRSLRLFRFLELSIAILLPAFALACFLAGNDNGNEVAGTNFAPGESFLQGAILSLLNPMHIPFWLGWSAVLSNKGILRKTTAQYGLYIGGIALGTLTGVFAFIMASSVLLQQFHNWLYLINCMIGCLLLVSAVVHIRKLVTVPLAVRHARLLKKDQQ